MKLTFASPWLAIALAGLGLHIAGAQTFSVDWHTIDGGGGTSTDTVYAVTGTIGQPDAGALTDGFYKVNGGFWSVIAAVTVSGAPTLTITRAGANVIVAWPYPSTGFGLQRSSALGPASWINVTNVPTQVGSEWQVTVFAAGNQFFRLAVHDPADTVNIAANAGVITSPFVITNGVLYQPVETTLANGGRAAFNFTLVHPGTYLLIGFVNAANTGADSFFVNVDAEPQDPFMIWDVPLTSAFEQRTVTWRGEGAVPKIFNFAPGPHQIVIRGREAYALLQRVYGNAVSIKLVRVTEVNSTCGTEHIESFGRISELHPAVRLAGKSVPAAGSGRTGGHASQVRHALSQLQHSRTFRTVSRSATSDTPVDSNLT